MSLLIAILVAFLIYLMILATLAYRLARAHLRGMSEHYAKESKTKSSSVVRLRGRVPLSISPKSGELKKSATNAPSSGSASPTPSLYPSSTASGEEPVATSGKSSFELSGTKASASRMLSTRMSKDDEKCKNPDHHAVAVTEDLEWMYCRNWVTGRSLWHLLGE